MVRKYKPRTSRRSTSRYAKRSFKTRRSRPPTRYATKINRSRGPAQGKSFRGSDMVPLSLTLTGTDTNPDYYAGFCLDIGPLASSTLYAAGASGSKTGLGFYGSIFDGTRVEPQFRLYEKWFLNNVQIRFSPEMPTNSNGTLHWTYDLDPSDTGFVEAVGLASDTSKNNVVRNMAGMAGYCSAPVYSPQVLKVGNRRYPNGEWMRPALYTSVLGTTEVKDDHNLRDINFGQIYGYLTGFAPTASTGSATIGYLEITYDINFYTPSREGLMSEQLFTSANVGTTPVVEVGGSDQIQLRSTGMAASAAYATVTNGPVTDAQAMYTSSFTGFEAGHVYMFSGCQFGPIDDGEMFYDADCTQPISDGDGVARLFCRVASGPVFAADGTQTMITAKTNRICRLSLDIRGDRPLYLKTNSVGNTEANISYATVNQINPTLASILT